MPTHKGALRLFRVAGITVFLHWSWFVVAMFEVTGRSKAYPSPVWNVLEYLSLFVIVTMHEFGHSLACRSVGGRADQIVLWPLGGVAYVSPPQRPGAVLWSIAAGPLVNLALLPVFAGLWWISRSSGWHETLPHVHEFLRALLFMNGVMLVFNLLPIHPLDGGQILRALLWFVIGRARSLTATTVIGFLGAAGLVALAVAFGDLWIGIIAVFVAASCWRGFRSSRLMARVAAAPRREGLACPSCRSQPPLGDFWLCGKCPRAFDTFESGAACPACGNAFAATMCPECGVMSPLAAWSESPPVPAAAGPQVQS